MHDLPIKKYLLHTPQKFVGGILENSGTVKHKSVRSPRQN